VPTLTVLRRRVVNQEKIIVHVQKRCYLLCCGLPDDKSMPNILMLDLESQLVISDRFVTTIAFSEQVTGVKRLFPAFS
jgi:hypothetical protein